ncbi:hypothetical protein ACTXT7_002350 [Hymenolepis weldensis]
MCEDVFRDGLADITDDEKWSIVEFPECSKQIESQHGEYVKWNENAQENPHERVTKMRRKEVRKRKQHSELVPAIVNESKPESKVEAVDKTESAKAIVNAVLRSRHTKPLYMHEVTEIYSTYRSYLPAHFYIYIYYIYASNLTYSIRLILVCHE